MERSSEKDKSSRKTRDERNRDRDSIKEHRDRDHKHRSSRDKSTKEDADDDDHRHHKHRSKHDDYTDGDDSRRRSKEDRDEHRRSSREYSQDRERSREPRCEREGSRDRTERSYEDRVLREDSNKRKDRGESEDRFDGSDKRARVSDGLKEERKERRRFDDRSDERTKENGSEREQKKERRRFDDGVKVKDSEINDGREGKREKRKFGDKVKKEDIDVVEDLGEGKKEFFDGKVMKKYPKPEQFDDEQIDAASNWGGSIGNGAALEPHNKASRALLESSLAPDHSPATKVSSISTTNENKGVNISSFHEVPGKSSTDGTASASAKSGSLNLDALAKAKKALQMHKELLKKIPSLNKDARSTSENKEQVGLKEGLKAPSSTSGILPTPVQPVTASVTSTPSSSTLSATAVVSQPGLSAPDFEAVKRAQEFAAKLGFRQDPQFAPLINMFPGQMPPEVTIQPKPAKAPVLRLDALGREIDEHGNVVNTTKVTNLSTLKVNINKHKQEAFQILQPELEVDLEKNPHFDARMGIDKNKLLRPKRMTFQFVEEGKWSKDAEIIKLKSQFGEAQAKELKVKQAQLAKAKAEPDINPNLIEVSERVITKEKPKEPIPEVEWWDTPLLHSGTYGDLIDDNISKDKLKMDKITIYVEHPRPIEPPAEPAPPPPQPLKLTKKEQKKLRTQRRLAREKDRQEMIRQGLIEPPKAKVKMSNLMKVLGSEATQDPTKLEMEVRSAAAEREQAHVDRNIARKLTPAERREKKERKLFDDQNTLESMVSIYRINSLSHPQTRFKVDVNAQENRLTGCAVISDGICVVVVEGGSKSIKRYGKLMLKRINWAAAVENEEEDEDEEGKPVNKCVLVWQGSVAKPSFHRFHVHECRTEAAAKKVFADAGVAHYWDLAVNFSED